MRLPIFNTRPKAPLRIPLPSMPRLRFMVYFRALLHPDGRSEGGYTNAVVEQEGWTG